MKTKIKIKELIKDILMGLAIGISTITLCFIIAYAIMGKFTSSQLEIIKILLIIGFFQGIGMGLGIYTAKNLNKTIDQRIKTMKTYKFFILICTLISICALAVLYFLNPCTILLIAIMLVLLLFLIIDLGIVLGISTLNQKLRIEEQDKKEEVLNNENKEKENENDKDKDKDKDKDIDTKNN